MSDLVEFLKARLDEDEQAAQRASQDSWTDPNGEFVSRGGQTFGHVLRHGPSRVLLEVEAKRRILERCESELNSFVGTGAQVATPYLVLRLLALVYAGHPDYREEEPDQAR